MTDIRKALEPCPFCGNATAPRIKEFDGEPYVPGYVVVCDASGIDGRPGQGCGCQSGWAETQEEAPIKWNARAENAQLKADLAKAEKERDEVLARERGYQAQLNQIAWPLPAEARLAQGEPVAWTFPSAEEFARATRMARGSEGLRAFARRVGVSPTTLCRIENGGDPDMKTARAIASVLPAPVQPAVKVRGLEWEPYPNPVFAGPDIAVAHVGAFGGHKYQVQRNPRGPGFIAFLAPEFGSLFWESSPCDTLEGAKAAAQADFERRILTALSQAALVSPGDDQIPGPKVGLEATHRHKKRGSTYALIGIGKMQAERWVVDADNSPTFYETVDMREVAIYRGTDDGEYWVRPREEFEDGRFEAIGGRQMSKLTPASRAALERLRHLTDTSKFQQEWFRAWFLGKATSAHIRRVLIPLGLAQSKPYSNGFVYSLTPAGRAALGGQP